MSFLYQVSDHASTELRIYIERAEQALKEQEKMWKATNEYLLKRVELWRKEKAEKEEEHIAEMEEVIAEAKVNAVVAVWEAKIKLAKYVANAGSQNLVWWWAALSQLTGEPMNTIQDAEG